MRKWVYWHKVTEALDDSVKVGSLLGLNSKETTVARFVEEEGHIDMKMYARVRFVGKMLRTAPAEEVFKKFQNA